MQVVYKIFLIIRIINLLSDNSHSVVFFDYSIRQIELSIREIGYGDATINKKMKDYVNLLFSIIDKIDNWDDKDHDEKLQIIKIYIEDSSNCNNYLEYFEKFRVFLSKNTFNNLTKDILTQ